MEHGYRPADNAACLVVTAIARKVGEQNVIFRALHEQRRTLMRQYPGSASSGPPGHKETAEFFLGLNGQLEHRRGIALAHRQKLATGGDDGIAVGCKVPPAEIVIKLEGPPNKPSMNHVTGKSGCSRQGLKA